jgi:hypothetical protein
VSALQPRPATGTAAAGEAGGSFTLARKGSLAGKAAPKIHVLGEAEGREMQQELQRSLKTKGHG